MADLFSPDEIALLTGNYSQGVGLGGAPQGWGPQPAISPDTSGITDVGNQTAAPAAPAAPAAGGLGFGGGTQGMIGLGLGLLAGNPFNKWGPAMQGYQQGAAADLARQQAAYKAQQDAFSNAMRLRQQQIAEGPQLVETGTNPYTNEKSYAWKYPGSTRLVPATFEGQAGGQTGQYEWSKMQPNYNEQGKDDEFMTALEKSDPITAKAVKDITEGRMPAQGRNLQKLIPLASRYDQNFTGAQDYQTRLATAKSFASGKDAETVKSYNQAITHAEKVWDLIPKIEGFNVGGTAGRLLNVPYGEGRAALSPEFASNRKQYEALVQALSGELMKASRGSGTGSEREIREWQERALAANSGAEMRGSVKGAMDFLDGAMQASAQKKSAGMKSQFQHRDLLSEKNLNTYDKIQSHAEGTAPQATTPAPAVPARTQPAPAAPAATPQRIPQQAIDMLRRNPNLRDQFESKYGRGSADRYLSMDYNPNAT